MKYKYLIVFYNSKGMREMKGNEETNHTVNNHTGTTWQLNIQIRKCKKLNIQIRNKMQYKNIQANYHYVW